MAKVRVYELARELGIESKLLVSTIKKVGIQVSSHQSTLTDDEVGSIRAAISGEKAPVVAKKKPATTIIRRRRAAVQEAEAAEAAVAAAAVAEETPSSDQEAEVPAKSSNETAVEAPPTPVETKDENVADVDAPKPISRKRSVGATIVRKASPEEIQKSEAEKRTSSRTEDSRGTKYTGLGTREDAKKVADKFLAEGGLPGETASERRDKKSRRASEEEATKAKPVIPKQKRGFSNTRQLLNEISQNDDGEELIETPYGLQAKSIGMTAQRKRDLKRRKNLKKTEITVSKASLRIVRMGQEISVGELAKQLKIKSGELIKKLMSQGVMASVNENVDFDTASLIASEYNFEMKSTERSVDEILHGNEEQVVGSEKRAPIVTIMGHVDHGKTSILDAIRKADVAAGEAGGITQHIGAYAIEHNGEKIAFLDTPGHEAFSSMRARGANITDIVILVVAADDGVMPQTVEAISHAKAAGVPLIVAINKMDKPNISIDRIFTELSEHGIQSEEWGGEHQFIKVSAHTKMGLDDLLDAILLQAEVLELKTEADAPAQGSVVEAHLDQGRGVVATVMVKHGTLRTGEHCVAGVESGRVRALYDHNGKPVKEAGPATPVEVLGLSVVPLAGDEFNGVEDEKKAKELCDWRKETLHKVSSQSASQSLDQLLGKMQDQSTPELSVIIKGDTQGSIEAICDSLKKINTETVRSKVIHKAVGGISESDLTLGEATGAVIIGFNVRAARGLDENAEKRGIVIDYFSVIYDLVESVKSLMAGKLPPIREEVTIGRAEVRQPIHVPKIGTIAGSAVIGGMINRNAMLRLIRDEIVIYDGKIGSLRRFKDDVKEVKNGYECGIGFENYNDVKEGDIIEAYEIKETAQTI